MLLRLEGQPLCFRFAATASSRTLPVPREHLRRPEDLSTWLGAVGLGLEAPPVSDELLAEARELREAIYRAASAVAGGARPGAEDRNRLNAWSARNDAVRVLGEAGAGWRFPAAAPARSALGVVAADAVETLGGVREGRVKVCSGEGCIAVFLDTSRGGSRRWCSMGTCGNRAKKKAMRDRAPAASSG